MADVFEGGGDPTSEPEDPGVSGDDTIIFETDVFNETAE